MVFVFCMIITSDISYMIIKLDMLIGDPTVTSHCDVVVCDWSGCDDVICYCIAWDDGGRLRWYDDKACYVALCDCLTRPVVP